MERRLVDRATENIGALFLRPGCMVMAARRKALDSLRSLVDQSFVGFFRRGLAEDGMWLNFSFSNPRFVRGFRFYRASRLKAASARSASAKSNRITFPIL
jgi:hypothetical protein